MKALSLTEDEAALLRRAISGYLSEWDGILSDAEEAKLRGWLEQLSDPD